MFPDDRGIREIERGHHRVRRLLVVVVEQLAAAGADAGRGVEAKQHADGVEAVDAIVADLAGAVVPVPVPLVMEAVFVEGPLWGRAEPEVVVHTFGDGRVLDVANAGTIA